MSKSIMDKIGAGAHFVGTKKNKNANHIIKKTDLSQKKTDEQVEEEKEKENIIPVLKSESLPVNNEEKESYKEDINSNQSDNKKDNIDNFVEENFKKISEKYPMNINVDLWNKIMPGDYERITEEASRLILNNMSRVEAVEKAIIHVLNLPYYNNKDVLRPIWKTLFKKEDKSFSATWRERHNVPENIKEIIDSIYTTYLRKWSKILDHKDKAFFFRDWHSNDNECMICKEKVEKGTGFRLKTEIEDKWDFVHNNCRESYEIIKEIYIEQIINSSIKKHEEHVEWEKENERFWKEEEENYSDY